MLIIQEHNIQINLVDGQEYLDNIGKIIRIFSQDNSNLQFGLRENSQLTILNPKPLIDKITMVHNSINLQSFTGNVIDNAQYLCEKTQAISQIINVDNFNRIGIRAKIVVEDKNFITDIRKKLFKSPNIQYFSLVLNDLKVNDDINCKIKFFTGSQNNASLQQEGHNTIGVTVNNQPSESIYVLDLDVNIVHTTKGFKLKELDDKFNLALKDTFENQHSFLDKISKHLF